MCSLGTLLKAERKKRKMTQAEFANLLGISLMSVRRYENDERKPRLSESIKIAQVLRIELDQLIGKEAAADVFWQSFKDKKAEEVELPDEHSNSASIPPAERIRFSLMKLNREGQERVADYAEALEEAPRFRNPNYEEYRED